MKYYTSYWSKVSRVDTSRLLLVQVSNTKPKWFRKEVIEWSGIYPDWDLVNGFKQGFITEQQYRDRYYAQVGKLLNTPRFKQIFENACRDKELDGVCLVCWEADGFCHRYIVGEAFGAEEL